MTNDYPPEEHLKRAADGLGSARHHLSKAADGIEDEETAEIVRSAAEFASDMEDLSRELQINVEVVEEEANASN